MIPFIKKIYHRAEALLATLMYNFPSRNLHVIGVTGTDGKTTTSHLIYHILKESDKQVSIISSIYADIGGRIYDTGLHFTTPRAWRVQRFLHRAVKAGSRYFVLETTSHAIYQDRVYGVEYAVSVMTNVTPEHLYHHASFDQYLAIKTELMKRSRSSFLNLDMKAFDQVRKSLDDAGKSYKTYSVSNNNADVVWNDMIQTRLEGDYNRENIMAAYAVCLELGLSKKEILTAIKSFTLPKGRYDIVQKDPFEIIIDFAHTSNSIGRLLGSIRKTHPKGNIIHVFGAASQRDDSKRPEMGRESGTYADSVILTEEDYRNESVEKICNEIAVGLEEKGFTKVALHELGKETKSYSTISDRQDAIAKAIAIAKPGDVVVLTGKGHEKSLNRKGKEHEWDEYKQWK